MTKKQKIKNNVIGAMKLHTHPWIILIKSMIVGALAGAIASFYRYIVSHVENINNFIYGFLRNNNKFIPLALIAIILISLLVGFISKTFKMIGGSGIPQVKGIISGYFNDTWLSTLIAKFVAGAIAIGAGLSLGREGPSIQMGANIADGFGRKFGKSRHERRILIAAGAGAGLAAAFGAPLAGVMFVLEEIFRYLSTTMLLAVCVAALAADYVSKVIFGMAPVFNFPISELLPLKFYWLLPILGIVTGLAGVIYNAVLIGLNKHMKNLFAKHPMLRPMPVFIIAVFIGLYFPSALGGGHHLLDIINLKTTLIVLMGTLLIKFLFSVFSFSSGVPGGIFFPLLLLGALIGGIFGDIFIPLHGLNNALFYNFVVFAMAGLFSGIVRAPITGIVLLTEMTNSFSHLLPISIVAIFAFVTANALGSKPVYDSLLDGMLEKYKPATENNHAKVMIEQVVEFSARAVNAPIRDLNMPSNALIVSIHRNDMDITPNGNTVILPNDIIQVVTDSVSEPAVRELVQNLFTYDSPEGIDPNDSIEQ